MEDLVNLAFDSLLVALHWVIDLVPIGVFGIVAGIVGPEGFAPFAALGKFIAAVLLALALQAAYYLVRIRLRSWVRPGHLLRHTRDALVMAFSTASSNATLPTALRVADEKLGLPSRVSRFVLTVGATANQNGTALFEGVTVLFLAQFFGVDLTLGQQVTVMFVCILGGIGTAGVPAGSLPVVALICGMVGVPPEGIGLVLGVDRFLDMCRTTLNVTGDLTAATVISRGEEHVPPASADEPAVVEPRPSV